MWARFRALIRVLTDLFPGDCEVVGGLTAPLGGTHKTLVEPRRRSPTTGVIRPGLRRVVDRGRFVGRQPA